MAIKSALWSVSGAVALLGLLSGPAQAGNAMPCGPMAGPSGCEAKMRVTSGPQGHYAPTTIQNKTPYDFLDSVHFQRAPNVNITRIHGLSPSVGLSDAPVGFTKGCHPGSTTYCRSGSGHTSTTGISGSPTYSTGQSGRVVAIGSGFDPSKFTPRIYGDPYTITPGIAHVPTSIVDRDPYRAQAVLDSGQARPNPLTRGGITPAFQGVPVRPNVPNPYPFARPPMSGVPMTGGPLIYPRQPMTQSRGRYSTYHTNMARAAGVPVMAPGGRYGSTVGADGTYWEQVSGPTRFGNMMATKVICKRQLPGYQPVPSHPAPCHSRSRY